MPVRTILVELDGDYAGWSATMRTNVPMRTLDALGSGDFDQYKEAIRAMVLGWDFVDEEGEPIPLPKDGGLERLPYDLLAALNDAYNRAMAAKAAPPKA